VGDAGSGPGITIEARSDILPFGKLRVNCYHDIRRGRQNDKEEAGVPVCTQRAAGGGTGKKGLCIAQAANMAKDMYFRFTVNKLAHEQH